MNMNQVNIGKMTLGVATPVVKYPMLILFCSSFALGSPLISNATINAAALQAITVDQIKELKGKITDEQGNPVVGATVSLVNSSL